MKTYYDEGYMQCICGEWTVSMHQSCKSLMTTEEYMRWRESQFKRIGSSW